jgi:hypothetical protein
LGLKSDISQAWIHGRRWTGDLRQAWGINGIFLALGFGSLTSLESKTTEAENLLAKWKHSLTSLRLIVDIVLVYYVMREEGIM